MTIFFNGSQVPNGSSDPDRVAKANPSEKMSDDQVEIGNLMNFNEKTNDVEADEEKEGIYTFPGCVDPIVQHEMVYECVFHLEPDMLNYYHTPPSSIYSRSLDGKPVQLLHGSPEFAGFYGTKWQVSVNFNRWIGMHRWMSIYLSRVDKIPLSFQTQCEFSLVDKNGLVIFSQRNNFFLSGKIDNGLSIGFSKFLPFSDVLKNLIDGNKLSMKVHVLLVSTHNMNSENSNVQTQQVSPECHSQDSQRQRYVDIDDCFYCPPALKHEDIPAEFLSGNLNSDLPVEDRIEIQLDSVRVAYASREKLIEKSPVYLECVNKEWDCTKIINIGLFSRESPVEQIRAIREYVNFIHGQPCAILENGSYRDAQVLLQFTLKLDTQDLIRRCLTVMTYRVDCENATDHARVLQKYFEFLNKDDFDFFKKFFKDHFLEIRTTQRFQELKNTLSSWLIRFLFN